MTRGHRSPQPTETPRLFSPELLLARVRERPLLLCLDYDGTISELVADPLRAFPIPKARNAIARMIQYPHRISIALVTGRDLETIKHLLTLDDGLMFAATHGLEIVGRDGSYRRVPGVEKILPDLVRLCEFIKSHVPSDRGFVVEDKGLSLTLNYRSADPKLARKVVQDFCDFVERQTSSLRILEGKMIREAVPREVGGKGTAVLALMDEGGFIGEQTAYFGDDVTDEEAFRSLRPKGALTVMVGADRPSFAEFRVTRPTAVADLLEEVAGMVGGR